MEAFPDGNGLEELLAVFEGEVEVGGDEVGKMAGVVGVEGGDFDLIGDGVGHFGDFLELLVRVAQHGLQFDGILGFIAQQFEAGAQIGGGGLKFGDPDAPEAFDEDADGAIGKFHHFGQARYAADFIEVLGGGFGDFGAALEDGAEEAVAGDDVIDQFEAGTGFDEEGDDGTGEDDDVGEAENGEGFGEGTGGYARGNLRFLGCAQDADEFCFPRCHHYYFSRFAAVAPEQFTGGQ